MQIQHGVRVRSPKTGSDATWSAVGCGHGAPVESLTSFTIRATTKPHAASPFQAVLAACRCSLDGVAGDARAAGSGLTMSAADLPLAATPRWRQWRKHPCYPAFLCWGMNVAIAVIVGTAAGSPEWLPLALPSALFCFAFGQSVISGSPNLRADLAERLNRTLVDVAGAAAFAVVVQDQTNSPCVFRRRRRPTLIAAAEFVEGASDEILRGVAAIQHALLGDELIRKRTKGSNALQLLVIIVVGASAAALAHRTHSTSVVGAALASVGLSTWISTAGFAAWSRTEHAAALYHEADRAAVTLAGNPQYVIDALSAMNVWRTAYRANCPSSVRLLTRCLQPLPADWHEVARAQHLREQTTLS